MRHRLRAPAKINLTLEVLGDLPGGYHELDSVFCSLQLADEVIWADAESTSSVRLSGDVAGLEISSGEDNLVLRALRSLEAEVGRALPLEIELVKAIPAGGGLGGGSADAAALLFGVNRSHALGISPQRLQQLGGALGADVAFGVLGGAARGRGRGDELEPVSGLPALELTLVLPPVFCPTGPVYRAWDADRFRVQPGCTQALLDALRSLDPASFFGSDGENPAPSDGASPAASDSSGGASSQPRQLPGLTGLLACFANDLEPAAERVQPLLAELRQRLEQAGFGPVLMCGSGSTLSCWNAPSPEAVEALLPGCRAVRTCLDPVPRS